MSLNVLSLSVYLSLRKLEALSLPNSQNFPKVLVIFGRPRGFQEHRHSDLHRVPAGPAERHGSRAQPTIQRDAHRCAERGSGADDDDMLVAQRNIEKPSLKDLS